MYFITLKSNSKLNAETKRYYRKVRSSLKKRLRNGGEVSKSLLKKYNLDGSYRNKKRTVSNQKIDNWISIELPKNFSLIKNHNATFRFLGER